MFVEEFVELFVSSRSLNNLTLGVVSTKGATYFCCVEFAAGDDLLFGSSVGQ
jgi:hypothetical protein